MGFSPPLSQELGIARDVGPMEFLPLKGEGPLACGLFILHEWGRACALVWGVSLSLAGVSLLVTVAIPWGPRAPWDTSRRSRQAVWGGQTQDKTDPGTRNDGNDAPA